MKWRLAAAWVLAVVATTTVAWQIVAVADEQVGESPLSPIEAAPPSTSGSSTTTAIIEPSITTSARGSTTSTVGAPSTSDTSTTAGSETSGSGGTTSTSSPSTSTTSGAAWSTKTVVSEGGTVVVSYRPGEARLETVVPLPGFQVEIDKPGPPEVDVEFEGANLRVRVKAGWENGSLDIEIDESPEEEDD